MSIKPNTDLYGSEVPVYASIKPMLLVGRMLCNNAPRNFTTASGIMHAQISPYQIPQACFPLSYAAQISTTPDPDLANVRVSLYLNTGNVRSRSSCFFARVCLRSYVRE